MHLLVTGGSGFIGSNFIRQLLAETDSPLKMLVNLDAVTYAGNPANLSDLADNPHYVFVHGDITVTPHVAHLLAQFDIDAIVNFAAETHVDRSIDSPEPFIRTNVVGTLRLLECARLHWAALPAPRKAAFRFLQVSTDEVYGALAPTEPACSEEKSFAPNSPYAASKAAGDHLVRSYHHTYQLPTLTTHCSNNYGPFQFPEKFIPLVILNALEGRPLPVYGDGLQVRDWLHVEDHAAAVWQLLQHGRVGETYNIGGNNEQSNLAIAQRLCALLDQKSPRADRKSHAAQITHVADRPGHDRRYALNGAKLQRELGWSPRVSFATGLAKTVDWYLAHRIWAADITARKYARERLGTGH